MSGGAERLVPGDGLAANEGLHGRFAAAPASLVRALLVAAGHPRVEVGLPLRGLGVDPLAERGLVGLVEHGLAEPLDDAAAANGFDVSAGLRAARLGAAVVDVLSRAQMAAPFRRKRYAFRRHREVESLMPCSSGSGGPLGSTKGTTRPFSRSAAAMGVLRP